jgi:hypothetical protein
MGQKTYKAAAAGYKPGCDAAASNSFHLLVVDRESPDVVLADNTYCTTQNPELLRGMATDLSGVRSDGELVFIATSGSPIPADWNFGTDGDARVYLLAQQMARLGGYFETMVYLTASDKYSLVGAPAAPTSFFHGPAEPERAKESSTVYPDRPSGELHGVLGHVGRVTQYPGYNANWYSPLNADTSGVANLGLYDILAQAAVSFPHPSGNDELAAFKYINNELCGSTTCNIRNNYSNLNINIGTTYQGPLRNEMNKDPNGNDCKRAGNAGLPYCVVRDQLLNELTDVSNIRAFSDNVDKLWLASQSTSIFSLLTAYDSVKATMPAPATAESSSLVRPLVSFFLGLAANIPVVGQAFGLADTAFNLGMDLTTDKQGNRTVDLTSTIGQLEDQAIDHFKAQGNTTGTMFQLIYQDWGKIDALGSAIASANGSSSPWYWGPTTASQMLNQMEPAVKHAAYQNVMAAAYAIGSYVPQTPGACASPGPYPVWGKTPIYQQPWAYGALDGDFKGCNLGVNPVVQPFNSQAAGYIPYTYPTDSTNPYSNDARTATILADNSWLAISLQTSPYSGGPNGVYNPPGETLLNNLFTPVSQGGLGVYRPAFFEGWPFPRVTCAPSFGVRTPDNRGSYVGGCDWASGASPVSQPPPAPTNVSIRATPTSSNQAQVNVLLTVHNNGPVPANSINLTSISLRTLAGSGQATVVSPSLPAVISGLAPGDSTDLVVTLNIPIGITKLAITEQGTANLGQAEATRFSDGEVLYPAK